MLRPGCRTMQMCREARPCSLINLLQPIRDVASYSPSHGMRFIRLHHSLYLDTVPPTKLQVEAAETFFRLHLPIKSWTATEWRKQPYSNPAFLTPEIAFLGRSNSGKSSLLNSLLLDRELCRVGPKPGKTITMHAWSLGPMDPKTRGARKGFKGDIEPKLNVLDMPGYGHGSRGDWGKDIMKYLTSRRQLRRAFVLVNPEHGLKAQDVQMLQLLRGHGISHQLIATKCDKNSTRLLPKLLETLRESIPASTQANGQPMLAIINDVLATGNLGDGKANKKLDMSKGFGLGDVRWAILRAAGLEDYALTVHEVGLKGLTKATRAEAAAQPVESATTYEETSDRNADSSRPIQDETQPLIGLSVEDFLNDAQSQSQGTTCAEESMHTVQSLPRRIGRIRPGARKLSRR